MKSINEYYSEKKCEHKMCKVPGGDSAFYRDKDGTYYCKICAGKKFHQYCLRCRQYIKESTCSTDNEMMVAMITHFHARYPNGEMVEELTFCMDCWKQINWFIEGFDSALVEGE